MKDVEARSRSEEVDVEIQRAENRRLTTRIQELEADLARIKAERDAENERTGFAALATAGVTRIFLGESLWEAAERLKQRVADDPTGLPTPELIDVGVSGFSRFVRVSALGIIFIFLANLVSWLTLVQLTLQSKADRISEAAESQATWSREVFACPAQAAVDQEPDCFTRNPVVLGLSLRNYIDATRRLEEAKTSSWGFSSANAVLVDRVGLYGVAVYHHDFPATQFRGVTADDSSWQFSDLRQLNFGRGSLIGADFRGAVVGVATFGSDVDDTWVERPLADDADFCGATVPASGLPGIRVRPGASITCPNGSVWISGESEEPPCVGDAASAAPRGECR